MTLTLKTLRPALLAVAIAALAGCGPTGENGNPGVPVRLVIITDAGTSGIVGTATLSRPTVKVEDAAGNGVPGISVRFDVLAGGGTAIGDSVVTDAGGIATVGEWVLGSIPGSNTLRAQALGFPFLSNINVTATAGAPASMQVVAGGTGLLAIVGQTVTPAPSVRIRDALGNPVAGVAVTFSVTAGGGTITGGQQVTGVDGRATVGSWQVGTSAGANTLSARTPNGITQGFVATAVGVPAALVPTSVTTQTGYLNFPVPLTPRVQVIDGDGLPVPGIVVNWANLSGDATIDATPSVTNSQGIASIRDWRMGSGAFSSIRATVPGFPGEVDFQANGDPQPPFTIDLRFLTPMGASERDAFVAAALRWMEIITGDLPNAIGVSSNCFGSPTINETVDDVIMVASVVFIDGPGGVLAHAGGCGQPRAGSLLTLIGGMEFDEADAAVYANSGQFKDVVIHEMGHMLGMFESRWIAKGILQGANGSDPIFTGTSALAAWPTLGLSYAGLPIPVENEFGEGTRDSHWRESILGSELMTGFVENAGIPMPISVITVASLKDLGYDVDMTKADPFVSSMRAMSDSRYPGFWINEVITHRP